MSDTDPISVSRLIRLVRERPVLWDRQEEVYKNRKLTRKAWTEICETLIDNYVELGEPDKKALGRGVIGKWANLRDNWLRYWRKRQDLLRVGASTKSLKKYIHHDQLLFLSKVYDPEIEPEIEEIQVDVDVMSDPEEDSPLGLSYDEVSHNPWNFSEDVEEREGIQLEPQERHVYFFHSIMPMICEFDDDQVLAFHSAVLESVRRVRLRISNTNAPSHSYITPPNYLQSHEPVTGKEFMRSKSLSKSMNMGEYLCNPLQQIVLKEPETAQQIKFNNSTVLLSYKVNPGFCSTGDKENSEAKPPVTSSTETNKTETDLTNLKNVVNKLEGISKQFKTSTFEDSFDRTGKHIGSLLRGLPPKTVKSLKRKIVKEIVRVKRLIKQNSQLSLRRRHKLNQSTDTDTVDFSAGSNLRQIVPCTSSVPLENLPSGSITSRKENGMPCTIQQRPDSHYTLPALSGSKETPSSTMLSHNPLTSVLLLRTMSTSTPTSSKDDLNSVEKSCQKRDYTEVTSSLESLPMKIEKNEGSNSKKKKQKTSKLT